MDRRFEEFLASKPQRWHRRLVQRPWLLPVIAMHLAARRLQRAWRTNWLQRTKPSAIGAEEEGLPVTPPVTPAPRKLHVAHAALRLRHIEHLRRRMVLPRDQAQDANYPVYESFESFCLALIQGWWQSKVHVWRVRRVQSYMGRKLYQVAAFEIQQAWQLYEHRLRSRSLDQSSWTEQEQLVHYAKMLAEAARKIQHKWRSYKDRGVFETLQETIAMFRRSGDPYLLLRAVLPREAVLLDPAMQVHVRFRLGGPRFPSSIFYKIYTHGNVVDLGSFAPREYHLERMSQEQGLALPGDLGWYRRVENNGWRPLAVRFASEGLVDKDVEKFTGRRAQNFHYSKLRRRQEIELKRRQRKIEWFQKLYGFKEDIQEDYQLEDETVSPQEFSPRELNEMDMEEDMLLDWSRKLDFDAYMESWQTIATTDGSEGSLPITMRLSSLCL